MRKELTIEELAAAVNRINNGETRKTVGESLGMSENTLSRRLKDGGYAYNNSTKKYLSASPTTKERKNEPTKEIKKQKVKEQVKERTNIHRKRASFDIDAEVLKELKVYAVQHDKNVYELVEAAIKQYLKNKV